MTNAQKTQFVNNATRLRDIFNNELLLLKGRWDEHTIAKFEKLINEAIDCISQIEEVVEYINWNEAKSKTIYKKELASKKQSVEQMNIFISNYKLLNDIILPQLFDMKGEDTFYNESWTPTIVQKFERQVSEALNCITNIETSKSFVICQNDDLRISFQKSYAFLKDQVKNIYLTMLRHKSYPLYRMNRRILVLRIADVRRLIKTDQEQEIFEWFNSEYSRIPLYRADRNNYDLAKIAKTKHYPSDNLQEWFKEHSEEPWERFNVAKQRAQTQDIAHVFMMYVECRKTAYAIFNTILSTIRNDNIPAWKDTIAKYEKQIQKYITNDMTDRYLLNLYLDTLSENEYIEDDNFDDYYQMMDEKSWNNGSSHLYESYLDCEYTPLLKDKSKICKINMVGNDEKIGRIRSDGSHVYSTSKFYPGDIVEICPTKEIDMSSLYSKDMRDIVFEVEENKRWVIPFGYCQYYDIADEGKEPNVDFIWDPIQQVIIIKAITKIEKDNLLILNNIE